jgi:hypothetical protein
MGIDAYRLGKASVKMPRSRIKPSPSALIFVASAESIIHNQLMLDVIDYSISDALFTDA